MNAIGIFLLTIAMTFAYAAAYFILKKQKYSFITGMRNRTNEEIKKLQKSGYMKATGRLYLIIAIELTIGLLLTMLGISYAFEIAVGIFVLLFVVGYIYIQKYELKERRQTAYLSSVITGFITIGIVGYILSRGFLGNELVISDEQIEITGPYGVEVSLQEIREVELLDELPEINVRTNGYAFGERLMGNFSVEEYGSGKLFVHRESKPYLFIELDGTYIIINSKDVEQTRKWHNQLQEN
ncbi:DUF3784 domain-containing protein [Oceanobacillus salinisoli]|uniref:DUF3784 domain-containing protein n=1 Tax=Oceanobacillus salinisoli TaxID=2678611 RepID=UPI0012E0D22B|nr:DUF3784 domain-containing protein [Oceanobacillus salinisoli]